MQKERRRKLTRAQLLARGYRWCERILDELGDEPQREHEWMRHLIPVMAGLAAELAALGEDGEWR